VHTVTKPMAVKLGGDDPASLCGVIAARGVARLPALSSRPT